jgi:hypothetical protein
MSTIVQSFYKGFPDGGSLSCDEHLKAGIKSSWNMDPQRTAEEDHKHWYVCTVCGKVDKMSNNCNIETINGKCITCNK